MSDKKRFLARFGFTVAGAIITLLGYAIEDRKMEQEIRRAVKDELAEEKNNQGS